MAEPSQDYRVSDPLKIMDEIERESPVSIDKESAHRVGVRVDDWQSLRTALERQQADIDSAESRLERQARRRRG